MAHLYGRYHVGETAGDVHQFPFGYVRVFGGRVEHEQPPGRKPHHAEQPRAVEHVRPAPPFHDEPAQWVRDGHADRAAF